MEVRTRTRWLSPDRHILKLINGLFSLHIGGKFSVTPKSGILLLFSCVAAIAAVGCVFELSSGQPELGSTTTTAILLASIPLTAISFWIAVQDTRANMK